MAKTKSESVATTIRRIQAGDFKPVYFITGEENLFIDQLSDFIETHLIDASAKIFDQTVVYGRDVTAGTLAEMAIRYPVVGPHQLILVKEAQDIKSWDDLKPYLEHPMQSTILVFCYRHKKMDKRTQIFQLIKRVGEVCEYNKVYDSEVPQWITDYVEASGRTIPSNCALLLAESLGNNLTVVVNELGKIFAIVGKGGTVSASIIEQVVGISKTYNVFELQNAIGKRDVIKCNKIINYFADDPKNNPIQMVLPSIYSYLIKLMIYIQLDDKSKAAEALGVNPFFVRDYAQAAGNYKLGKLASCIGYLYTAELRSKGVGNSGTTTDGEILKELIFKIIH